MSSLTIYPTSLALRQWQKNETEKHGFVDSRGHMSIAQFLGECAEAAQRAGLLKADDQILVPADDFDRELAIVESVTQFKASKRDTDSILGALSDIAVEDVLALLIGYIDPLSDHVEDFLTIIEADTPKNKELAELYRIYAGNLTASAKATRALVNKAVLAILEGEKELWPPSLKTADKVVFKSLRWVPPFIEMIASKLSDELGQENIILSHILQEHEQDWWGEKLSAQTGTLIFDEAGSDADWKNYTAQETITSLRESLAMQDKEFAADSREQVGFSCSLGCYGEVEDMARRIVAALKDPDNPMRPDQICLTARNLGDYSDAIMDVFERFDVPYYFRRGIPLMSVPSAKAVLNLISFSSDRSRDAFCALLESPWLDWDSCLCGKKNRTIITPTALADIVRRSGVEPEIDSATALSQRIISYLASKRWKETSQKAVADAAAKAFKTALGKRQPGSISDAVRDLLDRCSKLKIYDKITEWAEETDTHKKRCTYATNARAFKVVEDNLQNLSSYVFPETESSVTWYEVSATINRALQNMTVGDPASSDSGVWILTPHDVAGLSFRMLLIVGLNTGTFPLLPSQSPVFNDDELVKMRDRMGEGLAASLLAPSFLRNGQENLLFLSLLAAFREKLVLSRSSFDETGREIPASIFFNTLWRLVGWASYDDMPALPPDAYDVDRLAKAERIFSRHWLKQKGLKKHERTPMPGESFISFLPAELCCATDEVRQSAAKGLDLPDADSKVTGSTAVANICRGLRIETSRQQYFDTLAASDGEQETPEVDEADAAFVGSVTEEKWNKLNEGRKAGKVFSPTAIETLAKCPYLYYVQRILGMQEVTTNELEAQAMDFGTAVHLVMQAGYSLMRGDKTTEHVDDEAAAKLKAPDCRAWVTKKSGKWIYAGTGKPKGKTIAVAALNPEHMDKYADFFARLCDHLREEYDQGNLTWMLGAAEQANIEWKKIKTGAVNLVTSQLKSDKELFKKQFGAGADSQFVRCVSFLEFAFGMGDGEDAVILTNPDDSKHTIKLHGYIDRVDLVFDEASGGELQFVHVIDYKGKSKAGKSSRTLAKEIAACQDCQLPIYGVAAKEHLGLDDEVRVLCHYISYSQTEAEMMKSWRLHWIGLDGSPLKPEDKAELFAEGGNLLNTFTKAVFKCVDIFETGQFFVKPSDDYYCKNLCSFGGSCRFYKSVLAPASEDNG